MVIHFPGGSVTELEQTVIQAESKYSRNEKGGHWTAFLESRDSICRLELLLPFALYGFDLCHIDKPHSIPAVDSAGHFDFLFHVGKQK